MNDFRRPDPGNYVQWRGAVWIIRRKRMGVLELEVESTDELERMTVGAWQQGCYDGSVVMVKDPTAELAEPKQALAKLSIESLPASMQAAVKRKRTYIEAFLDPVGFYEKFKPLTAVGQRHMPRTRSAARVVPLLREVAAVMDPPDRPPSFTAFNGWLKDWQQYRDWRLMAPRYDRRGSDKRTVIVGELEEIVRLSIETVWMTTNQFSKSDVCNDIHNSLKQANKKRKGDEQLCVSNRQIYRYIDDSVDKHDQAIARLGKVRADKLYKPIHMGPETFHVLEIVEVDHTQAKLEVYDDDTGENLGRPWVTAAIDRCSRMVVGLHIHFEGQTTHAATQALRNSMLPKGFLKLLLPDMTYDYPCCGNPEAYFFDRGTDFISDHMKGVGLNCDIRLDYSPGENPQYKGKIERFFRTLHEGTALRMKGATPRIRVDGDRRPRRSESSISYSDFYERTWRFIALDYARDHHDGIGCAPLERWSERAAIQMPRPPLSKEKLDEYLMLAVLCTPSVNGVSFEGLMWQGDVLKKITSHPAFKDGKRIVVRIDEADVQNAFAIDPYTGTSTPLKPVLEKYMSGTSMFLHRRVAANVAKKKKGTQSEAQLLETKAKLRKEAQDSLANKATPSKTRARIARSMGIGDIAPSGDDLGSLHPNSVTAASDFSAPAPKGNRTRQREKAGPAPAVRAENVRAADPVPDNPRKTAFQELPDADEN